MTATDETRRAKWEEVDWEASQLATQVHHEGQADVSDKTLAVVGLAYGYLHPRAQVIFKNGRVILALA